MPSDSTTTTTTTSVPADSDFYVPELPQEPIDLWVPPAPGELQDPNQFDPLPVEVGPGDPPVGPIERVQPDDGTYPDPIATPNSIIPRTGGDETTTVAVMPANDSQLPDTGSSAVIGGFAAALLVAGVAIARLARRPEPV